MRSRRRGDRGRVRWARWRSRWRTTALLAPVLVEAGRPAWARELVEEALSLRPPLACCARLLALRGWLRRWRATTRARSRTCACLGGGGRGAGAPRAPRAAAARAAAVDRRRARELAPEARVAALEAAVPGGGALLPFMRHPVAEVRRAAVLAAAGASGHPEAPGRIGELERDPDPAVATAARAARERASWPSRRRWSSRCSGGFSLRRGAFAVDDDAWGRRRRALAARPLPARPPAPWSRRSSCSTRSGRTCRPTRRAAACRSTLSSARAVLDPPGAERSVLVAVGPHATASSSGERHLDADGSRRRRPPRSASPARSAPRCSRPPPRCGEGSRCPRIATRTGRRRLARAAARPLRLACSASSPRPAPRRAIRPAPRTRHDGSSSWTRSTKAAQRRLMTAYARAGRRGHALRQYLACRRALVDEPRGRARRGDGRTAAPGPGRRAL